MIFIQSHKDGGIEDSEAAMLRACHLSGQMQADQAIDHYKHGELVPDTLTERINKELEAEDDKDALACLVVFLVLVAAISVAVHYLY